MQNGNVIPSVVDGYDDLEGAHGDTNQTNGYIDKEKVLASRKMNDGNQNTSIMEDSGKMVRCYYCDMYRYI